MVSPSRELYRSGVSAVGTFRCRPSDDAFPGGWMDRPTIVFPRTCVKITQQGADTLVADANTVVLYRGRQEYSRSAVDDTGDHCEWFEIDPQWLREAARPFDPELAESDAPPLRHTHAPAPNEAYALQRSLTRLLAHESDPNPLLVDETLLRLVDLVIPAAYTHDLRAEAACAPPSATHRGIVDDAKAHMARHFSEPLSLAAIGAEVGASRFHLARMFRRVTGRTIHRHLTDLRLRSALGHLDELRWGIADIAFEVGFASHSHFTQAFRSTFGMTPSRYRRGPVDDLRTISTA